MFRAGTTTRPSRSHCLKPGPPTRSGFTGPALTRDFAQYAHDELIRRYGMNTVLEGDLSVYTTIELEKQVAGKTGTSEDYFDAWFIGFTPELVTGTWMGYADGEQTLEYVLDYARKLHGLSGGITPAEIWKAYTQSVLSGEPIEQFDGVKIPERADPVADPKPRVKYDLDAASRHASASPGAREPVAEPRRGAAASASASSVSPSRARESMAKRAGAARYSFASSSASATPR